MIKKFQISNFKFQITSLLLSTIYYLLSTNSVFAADCQPDQVKTDFGCIPGTPGGFTGAVYGIGLGLISSVALLFIVYGGYLILTSQGNPDQLNKGKSYIFYSIAGLILAVGGYAFYQTIVVDVIKIPGFSK